MSDPAPAPTGGPRTLPIPASTGFLHPAAIPITGVEILVREGGDCCSLTSLAIRLAPADAALANVIRQQVERGSTTR